MKLGRVAQRLSRSAMKMPKPRTGGQLAKPVDKSALAALITENLARRGR